MNQQRESAAGAAAVGAKTAAARAPDTLISELVGQVYESAPIDERGRMLEQLLRPLAILSLFEIANGVFVKPRLRGGWQDLHIRLDDIQGVRASDVVALADHAQQVKVGAVEGLAQLLPLLPVTSASVNSVSLTAALVRRTCLLHRGDPAQDHDAAAGGTG